MAARLKEKYLNEVAPALREKYGYRSVMEIPKIDKVVINMGVGEAVGDPKSLDAQSAFYCDYRTKVHYYTCKKVNCVLRLGQNAYWVRLRSGREEVSLPRQASTWPQNKRQGCLLTGSTVGQLQPGLKEQLVFPDSLR